MKKILFFNIKKAFTLAEILITLGIIGIVATITIPNLITQHQKYLAVSQVKTSYAQLFQAIKLSEVDNGPVSNWDFTTGVYTIAGSHNFFNTYLKPYLVNPHFCSEGLVETCGKSVSKKGVNYMLNNGVGLSIVTSGSMFPFSTSKHAYMAIDINNAKGPNKVGKDVFLFSIDSIDGFVPYGYTKGMTRQEIIDGYIATDGIDTVLQCKAGGSEGSKHLCTALIVYDGWKISDDYPWN